MGMDFMSLSGNDYVPSGILLPDLHDECSLSLSLVTPRNVSSVISLGAVVLFATTLGVYCWD